MYESNVLIVGAGPTGLTLAIELARRSIGFRLIDAAKAPFDGSRGKGVQPRTLEIFSDLGILEKILNTGMPYPGLRVHLGPLALRLGPLGGRHQATEAIPYPNLWLVPQNRTEAILRERLAELGGQVEFGTAFETVEQDEQWATVHLSTGESLRTKYLVGCDGGHSGVRKTTGLALKGEKLSDKLPFVADVEIPDLDHTVWHIWPVAKGGPIALCPLPEESLFQMTSPRAPENPEEVVYKVCKRKIRRIHWSSADKTPGTTAPERAKTNTKDTLYSLVKGEAELQDLITAAELVQGGPNVNQELGEILNKTPHQVSKLKERLLEVDGVKELYAARQKAKSTRPGA